MISQEEARARVARGAAHLDQVRPGWESRIDVGTLTLHDECGCILGQLCGNFFRGLKALEIDRYPDAEDYGFEHSMTVDQSMRLEDAWALRADVVKANHAPLQDAWIEAIADRRLKSAPVEELQTERVTA